jgi:hypothetical protein
LTLERGLLGLVTLYAGALALAVWLGLTALPVPRTGTTPAVLLVGAGPDAPAATPASLRAALDAAGVGSGRDGAVPLRRRHDGWPVADPFSGGRLTAHVDAADARALTALPRDLRLDRGGGEAVAEVRVPDRGALTRRLVWPVLRARLADWLADHRARPTGLDVIEDGADLTLRVRLAAHPRGAAAAPIPKPRLEAPVLPPVRPVDVVDSPQPD